MDVATGLDFFDTEGGGKAGRFGQEGMVLPTLQINFQTLENQKDSGL